MQKRRLPPKVHEKDGRYYYVDKNKWNKLSRVDEGTRELHRRLAVMTGQVPHTMGGIFSAFAESDAMAELAPPTRKQYTYFLFGILNHRFGHLLPSEINTGIVAQYLQKRKKEGDGPCGNRERSCLSSAFEFAMREGLASSNPCRGVRRNKERPSKVDLNSEALSAAIDKAPEKSLARIMQFGYLTGVRREDIMGMKVDALKSPKGIEFTESKTGKKVCIEWTDTLRGLMREILEDRHALMTRQNKGYDKKRMRILPQHDFLFVNQRGKPLTEWMMQSAMRRLDVDFTFRHLRPKAQTDGGDDRNVLGHTGRMREVYTRRRKLVPVR